MERRQSWSTLLRRQSQFANSRRASAGHRAQSRALVLETLEDRTVPTSAASSLIAQTIGVPAFAPLTVQGLGNRPVPASSCHKFYRPSYQRARHLAPGWPGIGPRRDIPCSRYPNGLFNQFAPCRRQ